MLTIVNWNLERVLPNQKRHERIEAVITELTADVWIFTESHKDVTPDKSISVTSITSEDGYCWSSICSKFPIVSLIDYVTDRDRCTAARIMHPVHGELIVYATVLPWVGSVWNGQAWQEGKAFISALDIYRRDWEQLQLSYPNAIHIVAGDFNQSLVDWHYYGSKKIRAKLEEVIEECNMRIVTAGINDPVARDSKPYACIDHICITTSHIERINSTKRFPNQSSPDKKLSDHFGIIVEVGLEK
jgi:hypothetical protein